MVQHFRETNVSRRLAARPEEQEIVSSPIHQNWQSEVYIKTVQLDPSYVSETLGAQQCCRFVITFVSMVFRAFVMTVLAARLLPKTCCIAFLMKACAGMRVFYEVWPHMDNART